MDKLDRLSFLTKIAKADMISKMNELIRSHNEHRKEYTAVLDRIEDILERLRQLEDDEDDVLYENERGRPCPK